MRFRRLRGAVVVLVLSVIVSSGESDESLAAPLLQTSEPTVPPQTSVPKVPPPAEVVKSESSGWGARSLMRTPPDPKPCLDYSDVTISGTCDRGAMDEVLASKMAAFKYCYEKGLQHDEQLEGAVVVGWVLNANDDMSATIVASSLDHDRVEGCVRRVALLTMFEEQNAGRCVYGLKLNFFSKPRVERCSAK